MMAIIVNSDQMGKKVFKSPEITARAFATYLVEQHKKNDKLNIALSGGSTPKLLFDILSNEFSQAFDWSKLHFYWGDERCVPPTHEDSNYKMTYDRLFSKVGIPEKNIHRVLGENDPDEEAMRYGEEIARNLPAIHGLPVFDIIILGMGGDGHTASIFPHQIELLNDSRVCAVGTNPDSGQLRVTLTGPVINNARSVCFLVTGKGKAERIDEIFNKKGVYSSYPASHIDPKSGSLNWYLDEAAAFYIK